MGGMFKGPPKVQPVKMPKLEKPDIPEPPKPVRLPTGNTQQERELALASRRRRRGYLSTILTENSTGEGLGG